MKHFQLQYLLILCSLLFGNPKLSAALTTSGTWSTTTISADETVNLTGDITLQGKITIEDGKTLTINGNDEARLIRYTGNAYMFEVKGTLIIKGTEGAVITLDAGGNLQWNAEKFDLDIPASRKKIGAAISNYGKIDLQYVTIRNVDDTDGETGGAIFVATKCSGQTLLDNCIIENCRSCLGSAIGVQNQESKTDSEAIAIKISNSIIRHCISGGGTASKAGGAIRTYGKTTSSLYLTNVIFEENRSKRANSRVSEDDGNRDANGGALFWNAHNTPSTKCYIDGCVFRNNRSDDNGGAIKSQASIEFLNNTTYIEGNQAPIGGGLYIEGYIGGADTGEHSDIVYELNQYLVVRNNVATNGGNETYEKGGRGAGIHFAFLSTMNLYEGSTITVNVDGAQVMNNHADTGLGGGIYLQNSTLSSKKYQITINLNHGIVQGNSAKQGGGMYIKGTTVKSAPNGNAMFINNNTSTEGGGGLMLDGGSLTMEHGIISNNTSNNGGGLYITNGGSFNMSSGEISNNSTTSGNGGGVFMQDGSVTITNGTIKNNISANYGGGLYVYNSSSTQKNASFNGGNIVNNQAKAGGGICTNGNVELTIGNVHVEDNIAINGGGLCLLGGASMDFGAGFIRFNNATQKDNTPFITAKEQTINDIQGVGGGVYLDSNSSLTFSSLQMGLYGNIADRAADDIFANGSGTAVTLPDVTTMNLADYPSAGTLYWVEDYVTEDTGYSRISYEDQPSDYRPIRYRVALENSADIYRVSGGIYNNKYVCLALGYRNLFATILKTGLKEGESAIFEVYKKMSDESYAYNTTILLTGQKGQTSVSKEFTVSEGFWKVVETNWSWGYDLTNPTPPERSIIKEITDTEGTDKTFHFINTAKEIPPVKYDEDIKVNIMNL